MKNPKSIESIIQLMEKTYGETYVGNDSTEVGVFGGQYVFDPYPSYPRITKLEADNVSNKVTGKLNVKLTITK